MRNSQSSRVKMSFVTAAMEKRARKALQRASMRAVLPEPTGLFKSASRLIWKLSRTQDAKNIPSNANGKGPLLPVAALD